MMHALNCSRMGIMPLGSSILATGALLISCLLTAMPAHAAPDIAGSKVVADINEGLNSNEGGTMISIVKDTTDTALGNAAIAQNSAAWRGNKMGASSSTVGGHLEIRDGLKGASDILNKGGVLIDHAGYASTAAGEMAEGNYAQGFITIADGLGKSVVTGLAGATGASFGSLLGPAGTVGGGAAAGYTAGWAWDKTFGKLNAAIKDGLGVQEDKARFRELAGPKMLGMTPEKIHENWLAYKKQRDEKNNLAAKEKEKKAVAPAAQAPKPKKTQMTKPGSPTAPGASGQTATKDKATPAAQPQSGKYVATSKPQTASDDHEAPAAPAVQDAGEYLGKWVLDKVTTEELKDFWNPTYFPVHNSTLSESSASTQFTYLDHGYDGRGGTFPNEELHNKFKYSWNKPKQEIYVYASQGMIKDPKALVKIKGRVENAGTTFEPAGYRDMKYAPFHHTDAHLSISLSSDYVIKEKSGESSASILWDRNPSLSKSVGSFSYEAVFGAPYIADANAPAPTMEITVSLGCLSGTWARVHYIYTWTTNL